MQVPTIKSEPAISNKISAKPEYQPDTIKNKLLTVQF